MSLFRKLTNDEKEAPEESHGEEEDSDGTEICKVPPETLIFDMKQREEFQQHLQLPYDEFWCQACNTYFKEEQDVRAHMDTEEHKKAEEQWKKSNPEDIFPMQRYRTRRASNKSLRLRALYERKRLRKLGLLPEAKTGQSKVVRLKSKYKFDPKEYHAQKRQKLRARGKPTGKK